MAGLEKLSIVIPTFGRPDFVRRQISYWSNCAVTVHIMDGSPISLIQTGMESIPSNVKYHHSTDDFFGRMRRATELIDTPYVAMLGDDDLFTKSGLKKCLDHLEGNSEVFGVVGRSMFFFHQRSVVFGEPKHPEAANYDKEIKGGIARLLNLYHPGRLVQLHTACFEQTSGSRRFVQRMRRSTHRGMYTTRFCGLCLPIQEKLKL